jgi:hypothetical protein
MEESSWRTKALDGGLAAVKNLPGNKRGQP